MSDTDIPITAVLSVSKEGLDCRRVSEALQKSGIVADVSTNRTVRGTSSETGCRVTMDVQNKRDVQRAWRSVQTSFGLGCAHVSVRADYQGCIYDFLAPSMCPGRRQLQTEADG